MLAEIWRYPIKSCGGHELKTVEATANGLAGDRAWAIVDDETGLVASAKHPARWKSLLTTTTSMGPNGAVTIAFADGREASTADPDNAAKALSALTGRPVGLRPASTVAEPTLERTDPDIAVLAERGDLELGDVATGTLAGAAPEGTIFDFAPVHVISTATLDAIEEAGGDTAGDRRRFRPNLVIDIDGAAFAESTWQNRKLAIGPEVVLNVFMQSPRCVVPSLAQADLARSVATARTVAAMNRIEIADFGLFACAGAYATVERSGTVEQGSPVTLLDQ